MNYRTKIEFYIRLCPFCERSYWKYLCELANKKQVPDITLAKKCTICGDPAENLYGIDNHWTSEPKKLIKKYEERINLVKSKYRKFVDEVVKQKKKDHLKKIKNLIS